MMRNAVMGGLCLLAAAGLFGETLSLDQVRELAIRNSETLAKDEMTVQTNAMSDKDLFYSSLPTVSLDVTGSTTILKESGGSLNTPLADNFTTGATLKASYTIWDGGSLAIKKKLQSITSEETRLKILQDYYSVLDSADSAYYSVLKAQATFDAAEKSLETATLNLSIAEIKYAGGVMSRVDYVTAQANKFDAESSRYTNEAALEQAKANLSTLIGGVAIDALEPVDFAALDDMIQTLAGLDEIGISQLYAALSGDIKARNLDLAGYELTLAKAEQNAAQTKLGLYLPSSGGILSVNGSAGITYNSPSAQENPDTFVPSFSAGLTLGGKLPQIGLTASVGLSYTGYDTKNLAITPTITGNFSLGFSLLPTANWSLTKTTETLRQTQVTTALDYANNLRNLDQKIQTAMLTLIKNARTVISYGRALELKEQSFDAYQELFHLGQTSITTFYSNEQSLRTAQNNFINAQYDVLTSLSTLRSQGVFDSLDELTALITAAASPGLTITAPAPGSDGQEPRD